MIKACSLQSAVLLEYRIYQNYQKGDSLKEFPKNNLYDNATNYLYQKC